ncbi:MAG: glycosyltransferase [Luteimonas sp.]
MFSAFSYHRRRLGARLHRMRLALHARGWRGLLARVARPEVSVAGPGSEARPMAAAPWAFADGIAAGRRILLIDVTTPRPDRDSGSLRAFNLMRVLRGEGFRVDFLPDDGADAGPYTRALRDIGVQVHCGPDVGSRQRWFARHAREYDAVVVSRYHLAEFLVPLLRRLAPELPVVLDTVDLHHLREQREAGLRNDRTLHRLAAATRRRELRAIGEADVAWVVSPAEATLLRQELPQARVEILPNLHEVEPEPAPFQARTGLLFVGGAGHPPNVDAARWLLEDIWPRVREQLPDCTLHIVGEGMPAALADATPAPAGVILHGHVPDLAPLLAGTRVGLAPLRFGAGVKGKINLCMAAGMPVVATTCAAEGMHLRDRHDILVADEAPDFAGAIVALYDDQALWTRLAQGSLDNVRRHFSFDAARATIAATFPPPVT